MNTAVNVSKWDNISVKLNTAKIVMCVCMCLTIYETRLLSIKTLSISFETRRIHDVKGRQDRRRSSIKKTRSTSVRIADINGELLFTAGLKTF